MRPLFALLASLLFLAGCVKPAAETEDDPIQTAATPSPAPTPASPTPATPASPSPASPTPTPTPSPAPQPEPEPAIAAPTPTPFNLTGQVTLGWIVAAGDGYAAEAAPVPMEQGQSDLAHCPDAILVMPADAATLTVTTDAGPANTDAQQAGAYALEVVAPDGTSTHFAWGPGVGPLASAFPGSIASPSPGEWRFHARPMGPVVQATWTFALQVEGASFAPPTALVVASGCA